MEIHDEIVKGLRAIWDVGVTPDMRPERAKHVRLFNIGMLISILANIIWFIQSLSRH
jgi:hypothetical protein